MIAAPRSGSGKTTIALGLLRAFRRRGLAVVGLKSGPDYIDPAFHAAASGVQGVNLDSWAMRGEQVRRHGPGIEIDALDAGRARRAGRSRFGWPRAGALRGLD